MNWPEMLVTGSVGGVLGFILAKFIQLQNKHVATLRAEVARLERISAPELADQLLKTARGYEEALKRSREDLATLKQQLEEERATRQEQVAELTRQRDEALGQRATTGEQVRKLEKENLRLQDEVERQHAAADAVLADATERLSQDFLMPTIVDMKLQPPEPKGHLFTGLQMLEMFRDSLTGSAVPKVGVLTKWKPTPSAAFPLKFAGKKQERVAPDSDEARPDRQQRPPSSDG